MHYGFVLDMGNYNNGRYLVNSCPPSAEQCEE